MKHSACNHRSGKNHCASNSEWQDYSCDGTGNWFRVKLNIERVTLYIS